MEGDIIKSFLVGLGFDVDESSLAAFNKSIQTAAVRVTTLYTAVNAFAASMVYAFSKISEGFEEMGYQYHIIAPAINKAIVLRNELLKAYSAAGINIRKVIVDSIKLNMSFEKTKFAMEAIYKSVGSKFFSLLQKQSDVFRKKLYDNMPKIISVLTAMVKGVFKAFDAVTQLGGRLWSILSRVFQFFVDLDHATNGWSTMVFGLIAAWKLLNLEFLATPLGMLLTGFLAILALYDDFKTFKEGGQSFFNWKPIIPVIEQITKIFSNLRDVAIDVAQAIGSIFSGNWAGLEETLGKIARAFSNIGDAAEAIFRRLGGKFAEQVLGMRDKVDKAIFGDTNKLSDEELEKQTKRPTALSWFKDTGNGFVNKPGQGNQPFAAAPLSAGAPLGSETTNNSNSVSLKQQTSISIMAGPNADATARSVGAEQNSVNQNLTRNLKRAHR